MSDQPTRQLRFVAGHSLAPPEFPTVAVFLDGVEIVMATYIADKHTEDELAAKRVLRVDTLEVVQDRARRRTILIGRAHLTTIDWTKASFQYGQNPVESS